MGNQRKTFGFVNLYVDGIYDCDDLLEAKNTIVFLVVTLNGYWKLPVGN